MKQYSCTNLLCGHGKSVGDDAHTKQFCNDSECQAIIYSIGTNENCKSKIRKAPMALINKQGHNSI